MNLLRMAFQMIEEQVNRSLTNELNRLEQEVTSPIKAIAQLVNGGSIWKGKSAQVFAQTVVQNMVLPGLGVSSQHISTTRQNVQRAVDIIRRADAEVHGQVGNLASIFASIY